MTIVFLLTRCKRMMGHGEPDPAVVESLKADFSETLDYYETILQKQDYLTGSVRIPRRSNEFPRTVLT